jgi:2-polyprenyl-3-methyl-5-hydroxy-6-metoxy-1,4-benzoquinol methylase
MAGPDPISLQQSFWNGWNATHTKEAVDRVSARQAEVVCAWLDALGRRDLDIIEVGCGAGWLCPQLMRFGRLTATDLSDEVLARMEHRLPEVTFVPGDFMDLDFGPTAFDVVVTLEVLSHVADQPAFIRKLASHLRTGGHLMMATQNRFVLQHFNHIPPPAPGQLRRWVDSRELRALLEPEFDVLELFSVTPRLARRTMARIKAMPVGPRRAVVGRQNGPERRSGQQTGLGGLALRWAVAQMEAMGLGWTLMALARKHA